MSESTPEKHSEPQLFPNGRRYAFRVRVYGSKFWFRVYVHASRARMHRYLMNVGMEQEWVADVSACCSCPAFTREKNCLGEINFYYPRIGPAIAAHEFQHAVQVVLGVTGASFGAPCKEDVLTPRSKRSWKKQKAWDARRGDPELAPNLIEQMMVDFHDECVRRNLWNT